MRHYILIHQDSLSNFIRICKIFTSSKKKFAQKSDNETVSKFANKPLNLNKRKFQFTLERYQPSDFGLDKAEKVKSLASSKLASLPIDESLIPRQQLTSNQKEFLTDFGINYQIPEKRILSEILPSSIDFELYTETEMDELMEQIRQLDNQLKKKQDNQQKMSNEIEAEAQEVEKDKQTVGEKLQNIETRLEKIKLKESELEQLDRDLNYRLSKVVENESKQALTQKVHDEFENNLSKKMSELEERTEQLNNKLSEKRAKQFQLKEIMKRANVNPEDYVDLISNDSQEFYPGNTRNLLDELGGEVLEPMRENIQNNQEAMDKMMHNSTMNSNKEMPIQDEVTAKMMHESTQNSHQIMPTQRHDLMFNRAPGAYIGRPKALDLNTTHQMMNPLPNPLNQSMQSHLPRMPISTNNSVIPNPITMIPTNNVPAPPGLENYFPSPPMPQRNHNNQTSNDMFEKIRMETLKMDISTADSLENFLDSLYAIAAFIPNHLISRFIINVLIKNHRTDLIPFMTPEITMTVDSFSMFLRQMFGYDDMLLRKKFMNMRQTDENCFAYFRSIYRNYYISRKLKPPSDHRLIVSDVEKNDITYHFINTLRNSKLKERLWLEDIPFNDLPTRAHRLEEILMRTNESSSINKVTILPVPSLRNTANNADDNIDVNECKQCGSSSHETEVCYASNKNKAQYRKRQSRSRERRSSRSRDRYNSRGRESRRRDSRRRDSRRRSGSYSNYRRNGSRNRSNSYRRKRSVSFQRTPRYRSYSNERNQSYAADKPRNYSKSPRRDYDRSSYRERSNDRNNFYQKRNNSKSPNRSWQRSKSPYPKYQNYDWHETNINSSDCPEIKYNDKVSS